MLGSDLELDLITLDPAGICRVFYSKPPGLHQARLFKGNPGLARKVADAIQGDSVCEMLNNPAVASQGIEADHLQPHVGI